MDNQTKIDPKIINILILIFLTLGEERPLHAQAAEDSLEAAPCQERKVIIQISISGNGEVRYVVWDGSSFLMRSGFM